MQFDYEKNPLKEVVNIVKTMIVNKNEEKRELTAPVMIPYYDDCDAPRGEKQFSPEEIGVFMDGYMENFQIVEPGHSYLQSQKDIGTPFSWQLEEDTEIAHLLLVKQGL